MAFGKTKKYKKIVKTIFPAVEGGEMQLGNISKLVYFCEMNPEQLQKVGPYIESKAQKNLSKKRLSYVSTCIIIIRELIKGCRKHLALFSGNATRLMKLILNTEYPDLQIEATETFIRFASVQDDSVQIPPDIEEFIKYFIIMAKNMNNDDTMRRTIRGEGLRGVTAYVSLSSLTDDLDTFITKHTDIIYTILDNMQYRDQIPSPNLSDRNQLNEDGETTITNVKLLATECLKDLSGRVDNITVASLVTTIVNYLDSHQKWNFDAFAVHALTSVTQSIKGQNYTIMLTSFLRHLELDHPPLVTKEIVLTSVAIVNDTTSSINMVITSLLKVLVKSIDNSAKHLPDVGDQFTLQQSIVDSIGLIGKKIKSTSKKVEIMNQIINSLRDLIKSKVENANLVSSLFIQCISQVSSTLNDLQVVPTLFPLNDLTIKLIEYNDPSSLFSPETKSFIQTTFQSFLTPQNQFKLLFEQLVNSGSSSSSGSSGPLLIINDGVMDYLNCINNGNSGSGSSGGNNKSISNVNTNIKLIRESVICAFKSKGNQPNNVISLFKTLILLLCRNKSNEIQYTVPMLLQLENQLNGIGNVSTTDKLTTLPIRLSRSIHLSIIAYLLVIARIYKSIELEEYVNSVLEYRKSKNLNCKYLQFDSTSGLLVISNSQKQLYNDNDTTTNNLQSTSVVTKETKAIITTTTTTTIETPTTIEETIKSEKVFETIEKKDEVAASTSVEIEQVEIRKDIIDHNIVIDLLCGITGLTGDHGQQPEDFKSLLLNNFNGQPVTATTNTVELFKDQHHILKSTSTTTTATISDSNILAASNEIINTTVTTTTTTTNSTITSPMKLPILTKSRESIVLGSTIPNYFQKSLTFDSFKQFVNYFDSDHSNNTSNFNTPASNQQQQQHHSIGSNSHLNNSSVGKESSLQNGGNNGSTTLNGKVERNNLHSAIFDLTFELACNKMVESQNTNKEYSDLMEILNLSEQQRLLKLQQQNELNDRAPIFI